MTSMRRRDFLLLSLFAPSFLNSCGQKPVVRLEDFVYTPTVAVNPPRTFTYSIRSLHEGLADLATIACESPNEQAALFGERDDRWFNPTEAASQNHTELSTPHREALFGAYADVLFVHTHPAASYQLDFENGLQEGYDAETLHESMGYYAMPSTDPATVTDLLTGEPNFAAKTAGDIGPMIQRAARFYTHQPAGRYREAVVHACGVHDPSIVIIEPTEESRDILLSIRQLPAREHEMNSRHYGNTVSYSYGTFALSLMAGPMLGKEPFDREDLFTAINKYDIGVKVYADTVAEAAVREIRANLEPASLSPF
ncbi:MAG: hypothetical protein OXR66_01990 [Candidatus Woesearchaeota archaeon]|nr:hypothetical protein [Candidatus Woesearchaeota archaeon]